MGADAGVESTLWTHKRCSAVLQEWALLVICFDGSAAALFGSGMPCGARRDVSEVGCGE